MAEFPSPIIEGVRNHSWASPISKLSFVSAHGASILLSSAIKLQELAGDDSGKDSDGVEDENGEDSEDTDMIENDSDYHAPDEATTAALAEELCELSGDFDDDMDIEHTEEDLAEEETTSELGTGKNGDIFEDGLTDSDVDSRSDSERSVQMYDDSDAREMDLDHTETQEERSGSECGEEEEPKPLQREYEASQGRSPPRPASDHDDDEDYVPSQVAQSTTDTSHPNTFDELEDFKYRSLYFNYEGNPVTKSFKDREDEYRSKLLEITEAQKTLEEEKLYYQEKLCRAKLDRTNAEEEVEKKFEEAGISRRLRRHYDAFCESLEPHFGQRGGILITCKSDHHGSYVNYDPEFALFKEALSDSGYHSYEACNWRCEAMEKDGEFVVEF